jgi:predicted Zn-dependent peptidase
MTRGYVRQFETSDQLAHAAARLAMFELPADTYDRLVPEVEAVTPDTLSAVARAHVRPADAIVVVVGDAAPWRGTLTTLGRPVEDADIEF